MCTLHYGGITEAGRVRRRGRLRRVGPPEGMGRDLRTTRSRLLALPALALLLVVVATAAVTTSKSSTPNLNEGAAVNVLSSLMTLFLIFVTSVAFYMLWSVLWSIRLRRGPGSGNEERVGRRNEIFAGLAAFGTVAMIVLLVRAFGISKHTPQTPGGLAPSATIKVAKSHPLPYSPAAGGITALAVALLIALIFLIPRARRARRDRSAPDFSSFAPSEPAPVDYASGRAAAHAIAKVEVPSPESEPDPRRAVIAAWIAMTAAIAEVWRPRRDSEAPREYLQSALAHAGVRPASAERLTDLFEEARFAGRSVGEPVRADAIATLAAIRRELAEQTPGEQSLVEMGSS